MSDVLLGFKPGEECSVCKGRCCKECGCSLSPDDLTEEQLKALGAEETCTEFLKSENCLYAIDMARLKGSVFYYLRMRSKCYTFIGIEGYGECIALTDKGCELSFEKRPKGGRGLKSSADFRCIQEYTSEEMVVDWKPYQKVLEAIWKKYSAELEADGTIEKCEKAYEMMMRERMKNRQV